MVEISEHVISEIDLQVWYQMHKDLQTLRNAEMVMRKRIAQGFFPRPKEGTNSHILSDGYILKMVHNLTREIDEGAFKSTLDEFRAKGINPDLLVNYKPSLVKREYNKLTEDEKHMVDHTLIIKNGAPSLAIVEGKK